MQRLNEDPESDEPPHLALLGNLQKLRSDVSAFQTIGNFFKGLGWLFELLPIVLTLVALALFVVSARPILTEIVQLPGRAAAGQAGAGRQVVKSVFRRIWRELLATLCFIGVLVVVTIAVGMVLAYAVKPAMEALLAYLIVGFVYIQSVERVSSGLLLVSIGSLALFLALNLMVIILSSGFFLGKVKKIFTMKFQDRVPLRAHARFWKWGLPALAWVAAFPLLYMLAARPLVEKIIDASMGAEGSPPNWTLIFLSGPGVLLGLFLVTFWLLRGVKGLGFLLTYKPKAAAPPPLVVATPSQNQLAIVG